MLFDLVLDLWLGIINGINEVLPVGETTLGALGSELQNASGNVFYYVDVSPIVQFFILLQSVFMVFVGWKLITFIISKIPIVGN